MEIQWIIEYVVVDCFVSSHDCAFSASAVFNIMPPEVSCNVLPKFYYAQFEQTDELSMKMRRGADAEAIMRTVFCILRISSDHICDMQYAKNMNSIILYQYLILPIFRLKEQVRIIVVHSPAYKTYKMTQTRTTINHNIKWQLKSA